MIIQSEPSQTENRMSKIKKSIVISSEFKPIDFERFRTEAGSDCPKQLNQIAIRQMQIFTVEPVRSFLDGTGKEGEV